MKEQTKSKDIFYLIYDGDCILCNNCAMALKIKKSAGDLELINARTQHPLIDEAVSRGYDLNEGILVKYHGKFYYGVDAIHFMAALSSPVDCFNQLNGYIFRSRILSALVYPIFKLIRKLLLKIRRVPKIQNKQSLPLYQLIFGDKGHELAPVFKARYGNHTYSQDCVIVVGKLTVEYSRVFKFLSPIFRLMGALVPYKGGDVPVTVKFLSSKTNSEIHTSRIFYFPEKGPQTFNSYLLPAKNSMVIEFMKFCVGWRATFQYANQKVTMTHHSYVLRIFNCIIPLPLSFLIGKGYAEETALSKTSFGMLMNITHPLFGRLFQYTGEFNIAEHATS